MIYPFKSDDLKSILKSLDSSKSTGINGISPKMPLQMITGVFPGVLNETGGQFEDTFNYRPISIMAIVSKVIEKHVTKHSLGLAYSVQQSLTDNKPAVRIFSIRYYGNLYRYKPGKFAGVLLYDPHSGFRKNHTCQTALIKLINDWLSHIDKGNIIGAIFFDLKKAFDVVDHEIPRRIVLVSLCGAR